MANRKNTLFVVLFALSAGWAMAADPASPPAVTPEEAGAATPEAAAPADQEPDARSGEDMEAVGADINPEAAIEKTEQNR